MYNFSYSKNFKDHQYSSFWSYRSKSIVKQIKKELRIPNNKALDICANCFDYSNWEEFIASQKRGNFSYYRHPFTITKDDLRRRQEEYNIPEIAVQCFRFRRPSRNNLRVGYLEDFLRSNCSKAMMPVFEEVSLLYRKYPNEEYDLGTCKIKGDFLYIETYRGYFTKDTTYYFVKILRKLWKEFPELKIYFSYHGIVGSSPFNDSTEIRIAGMDLKKRDLMDWSQLPVLRLDLTPFSGESTPFFEYIIDKPF